MPYNLRKRKTPVTEEVPPKKVPKLKKEAAPKKEVASKEEVAPKKEPTLKKESTTKKRALKKDVEPKEEVEPKNEVELKKEEEPKKEAASKKEVASKKDTATSKKEAISKKEVTPDLPTSNQLMFGHDGCGELGLKRIDFLKKKPSPVPLDEKVQQIACGPMHTLSLTESGKVYAYGCNDEGALGRVTDGDETLEATPTIVPLNNKVIKVTAGDSHSAALTDKDEVFVWGNFKDEHGSVGLAPECNGSASYKPIQIMPKTKFQDLASGSNHMLLLGTDGVVYSFGVGAQGQLGRLKSDEIEDGDKSHAITADNRDVFLTPKPVSLKDVDPQRPFVCDAVYAGNYSSFATNTDKKKNRLAGWGLNNYFQLGYKGQKGQLVQHFPRRSTFTCSTSMINVACGQHHTLFLTKTGRVYVAGRHEYGRLGLGKVDKEVCPAKQVKDFSEPITTISAGICTSFAVSESGKLYSWGMNGPSLGVYGSEDDLIVPTEVETLKDQKVKSVSTGSEFTAVLVELAD